MEYLIASDINTDEELNRIELKIVRNISVMTSKEINGFGWMYGCHAADNKEYVVVQFTNKAGGIGFYPFEKKMAYIWFE